ncbi:MAG: recombinase family protein [Oscillospiraceae bacterium]|nr:recombinase family protein [Oscillospiraceae bacterium]
MQVGYVRVSSLSQNTERQEAMMNILGVDKMFIDHMSGKDMERPELKNMIDYVREGDTVVVESISRLARNTKDLLDIMEILTSKGVEVISKKEAIDTKTPSGRFMLSVMGAIAEMEREYIRERQAEGIAIAKSKGVYKGRKPKKLKDFESVASDYMNGKITGVQAARLLGIARSTWSNKIKEYKKDWINKLENEGSVDAMQGMDEMLKL